MSKEKEVGVYIIQNKDTLETYIGSGVLESRQQTHKYLLERGNHWNKKLQSAYNINPNFDFIGVPIDDNITREEKRKLALEVEQDLINYFWGSPLLKNIAKDVEKPMTGFKHSEETKEKNRQAQVIRCKDPEYLQKIGAGVKKAWENMSEDRRAQHSETFRQASITRYANLECSPIKGQKRSEEFCQRKSEYIKRKWQDPEYRENQRIGREGKQTAPKRKVIVDGIEYESITDAALVVGISKQGLSYRCSTDTFPTYNYG